MVHTLGLRLRRGQRVPGHLRVPVRPKELRGRVHAVPIVDIGQDEVILLLKHEYVLVNSRDFGVDHGCVTLASAQLLLELLHLSHHFGVKVLHVFILLVLPVFSRLL
jgi:hypothetical protein